MEVAPVTPGMVEVQLVADPVTLHKSAPVGAGKSDVPETRAVNVSDCPTVGLEGVLLTKIVGTVWPRLIARMDEVTVE
ncbi:MAG: hypothetical protein WCL21_18935 [Mariniphaga sp.]